MKRSCPWLKEWDFAGCRSLQWATCLWTWKAIRLWERRGCSICFGFAVLDVRGELKYEKRWALNREEEKKGFEMAGGRINAAPEANPKMHVYHFGPLPSPER